jgi:hypothetical protein
MLPGAPAPGFWADLQSSPGGATAFLPLAWYAVAPPGLSSVCATFSGGSRPRQGAIVPLGLRNAQLQNSRFALSVLRSLCLRRRGGLFVATDAAVTDFDQTLRACGHVVAVSDHDQSHQMITMQ